MRACMRMCVPIICVRVRAFNRYVRTCKPVEDCVKILLKTSKCLSFLYLSITIDAKEKQIWKQTIKYMPIMVINHIDDIILTELEVKLNLKQNLEVSV